MNLIIDAGNSYVKIAVFNEDKLCSLKSVKYPVFKTSLDKILKHTSGLSKAILSSVGELTLKDIEIEVVKKKISLLELSNHVNIPFSNLYKTPTTLGKDRLALVAAAMIEYSHKNVLVIDAGTCMTFDFKNDQNQYLGGAISPGLTMRYKALNSYTNGLPLLEKEVLNCYLGSSTTTCIHSGVVNGVIQEINGVISQYQSEYKDLTVILTGGDANFLSKQFKSSIFVNSNFLLEGLNYLLNYNLKE